MCSIFAYIYIHIYAYIHACMHAYINTYIHTYIHTYYIYIYIYIISLRLFADARNMYMWAECTGKCRGVFSRRQIVGMQRDALELQTFAHVYMYS